MLYLLIKLSVIRSQSRLMSIYKCTTSLTRSQISIKSTHLRTEGPPRNCWGTKSLTNGMKSQKGWRYISIICKCGFVSHQLTLNRWVDPWWVTSDDSLLFWSFRHSLLRCEAFGLIYCWQMIWKPWIDAPTIYTPTVHPQPHKLF